MPNMPPQVTGQQYPFTETPHVYSKSSSKQGFIRIPKLSATYKPLTLPLVTEPPPPPSGDYTLLKRHPRKYDLYHYIDTANINS